jgi:hypothetical protein
MSHIATAVLKGPPYGSPSTKYRVPSTETSPQ